MSISWPSIVTLYHDTNPDERENITRGIKLISRPTDVSPIGPFFLAESRTAAIEWAKKTSNGLLHGDKPGALFTYELNLDGLIMYNFGEELSGETYKQWQKFIKYNWSEAAGTTHPDYSQYDIIRCLTSKGPRPVIEPYKCDDGSVMVQVALLIEKAIGQCRLVSMEGC